MKKKILLLILTLCTLYSWGATVTINGKQLPSTGTTTLTSQNTDYGITSGSIIFNAAANTLTLRKLIMSVSNHAIEVDSPSDFKILLDGTSTINVDGSRYGFNLNGNGNYTFTTISSIAVPQSLKVTVTNGNSATAAIRAAGASTTVDYCNMVLSAPCGFRGNDNPLTLKEANIKSTGKDSGSMYRFSTINYERCKCQTYAFNSSLGGIADNVSIVKSQVYIYRVYPIQVYGTQVTDLNKGDIKGDGKVTYSEYGYSGGVLTLKDGANINAYSSNPIYFEPSARNATIYVGGRVTLTGNGNYSGIYSSRPLMIYSNSNQGSITVNGGSGQPAITCEYGVEFSGVDATLKGSIGICNNVPSSNSVLSFKNSNVNIQDTGSSGVVTGFGSVKFEGCCITTPTSVTYESGKYYSSISVNNGRVKNMVISKGTDLIAPTLPSGKTLYYDESNTDEKSISLTWNEAEDNLTSKANLKYHVFVKEGSNSAWNQSFDLPKGSTSTTLTNLKPGTTYTIRLRVGDEADNYSLYTDKVITTPVATVAYDLWIEDVQVTNKNCNDFFHGLTRYNPENNTLTLNSSWLIMQEKGYDYPIVNHIDQLHIKVIGTCGLKGLKGGLYSTEQVIIEGEGIDESRLDIYNEDADMPAIYAENGMSIEKCEIYPYKNIIEGNSQLWIIDSRVTCKKIRGFENLHFVNTYVKTPRGGEYDETKRVLDGGDGYVLIDVRKDYGLRIAGIDVNSYNENDVFGNGTVSYDDVDKVLYLNNANLVHEYEVILNNINFLRIRLIGDNVLVSRYAGCIDSNYPIIIEGYTPSYSKLTMRQYTSEGFGKGDMYVGRGSTNIKNCTIDGGYVYNKNKYEGYDAEIYIDRAQIDIDNFVGFANITLNNSRLANGEARYDTEQELFVIDESGAVLSPVYIQASTFALERKNIYPGDNITTSQGTATYDAETSTLTLKDVHLGNDSSYDILTVFDDLTIRLEGDNTIEAAFQALVPTSGDLTIEGPGTLAINAPGMAFTLWGNRHTTYGVPQNVTLRNTKVNINCDEYASYLDATDFHILNSDFTINAENGTAVVSWHSLELENSIIIEPTFDFVNGNSLSLWLGNCFIIQACGMAGDIDGNGVLTPADVTLMISYLKGVPAGVNISDLDLDGDGRFTKNDIDSLVNKLLGK